MAQLLLEGPFHDVVAPPGLPWAGVRLMAQWVQGGRHLAQVKPVLSTRIAKRVLAMVLRSGASAGMALRRAAEPDVARSTLRCTAGGYRRAGVRPAPPCSRPCLGSPGRPAPGRPDRRFRAWPGRFVPSCPDTPGRPTPGALGSRSLRRGA
eukprot:13532468-Alexandrium_andersonii.AAC.1